MQDTGTEVLSGMEGVLQIAADPQQDTVLNAMMGVAGLLPTVTAIEAGTTSPWPIKRRWWPAASW